MIIILTTVSKKPDAQNLAKKLVEKKLAACINIIKIENSVFQWKGKSGNDKEFLLIIKTAAAYNEVERFIRKNHPYELPEIIYFKIDGGFSKYLKWVASPR